MECQQGFERLLISACKKLVMSGKVSPLSHTRIVGGGEISQMIPRDPNSFIETFTAATTRRPLLVPLRQQRRLLTGQIWRFYDGKGTIEATGKNQKTNTLLLVEYQSLV